MWRFMPRVWQQLVNVADPRAIEREAEAQITNAAVVSQWLVSKNPDVHAQSLQDLFDGGVTHVFLRTPQRDQARMIRFYGRHVLPRFR